MNIREAFTFFRKNNKQTQKTLAKGITYEQDISRFIRGKTSIDLDDFLLLINKLSITLNEFFSFCDTEPELFQNQYEILYKECVLNKNNIENKEKLLKYYHSINNNISELTNREISNLFAIKLYFSNFWIEIEQISSSELTFVYKYLDKREYYTHYDYSVTAKCIHLLDTKKRINLMKKAFPIKNYEKRTNKTKQSAFEVYRNLIYQFILEKNYEKALIYIIYGKNEDILKEDYRFNLNLVFMESIIRYIETKNLNYYDKIVRIHETVKDIEDMAEYENMQNDIDSLLKGNDNKNFFNVTI